ncbi:hypothetical protein SCB71_14495 [Herbiconiux sp. KACC 21604]|uniref:hypothetical protein n=1 Tax=unclassified Herbiconiux TaxID=2618217 RepID=UPI00149258C6|nr:hypothetical protein [Herbiconiux sp. SALV-R1]QJU54352.1 hypothetical protein HL652_12435 [Herbiconiux sp. SALV-R1]WPO85422.1 hypothetical protein SCB71_14495 [Herbiconiux sp. KACC 21604]
MSRTQRNAGIAAFFLEHVAEVIDMIDLVHGGARTVQNIRAQLLGLRSESAVDRELPEGLGVRADTAERLIRDDFSVFHSNCILGAWGALEATVDDFCVSQLKDSAVRDQLPALQALKVPLGEFLGRSEEERWDWVLEHLKVSRSSVLKPGVGQFESILGDVNLGGKVDDDLRKLLFEVKALRNAIAHRGGKVDQRLIDALPGWGMAIGDRIHVGYEQVVAALLGMSVYVDLVVHRSRGTEWQPGGSSAPSPQRLLSTFERPEAISQPRP